MRDHVPPYCFPLSNLPRELRDEIYRAILVFPHGVRIVWTGGVSLSANRDPRLVKGKTCYFNSGHAPLPANPTMLDEYLFNLRQHDECPLEILERRGGGLNVAVLRANRQVYSEAIGLLYSENTFIFTGDMVNAATWLSNLAHKHRKEIRTIKFLSTAGCFDPWSNWFRPEPLTWPWFGPFLTENMRLDTVEMTVSSDKSSTLYNDFPSSATDSRQRWWPAAKHLILLVMVGNPKRLKLLYPSFPTNDAEHPQRIIEHPDINRLHVVEMLREPLRDAKDTLPEHKYWPGEAARINYFWRQYRERFASSPRLAFRVFRELRDEGHGVIRPALIFQR